MKYLDFIKQEMAVIMDRDPAIKSKMEVFLYPSFWALLKYRKAHKLYKKGHFYRARKLSQRTARKTGIVAPGWISIPVFLAVLCDSFLAL